MTTRRIVSCKKCGKEVDAGNRFCERCGAPIHLILDSQAAESAEFIDIFNSVFNLLANSANLDRTNISRRRAKNCSWQRAEENTRKHTKAILSRDQLSAWNRSISTCKRFSRPTTPWP